MAHGIRVQKSSGAQRMGHAVWSQAKMNAAVNKPAMHNLAEDMKKLLVDTFNDSSIRYLGGMANGFGVQDIDSHSVGISQSAAYEQYIRQGTKAPYKGFPRPLVAWGLAKLGSIEAGFAVAKSISGYRGRGKPFGPGKGTADFFRTRWPSGERRFEYPEWAVNEFKPQLDKLAKAIGDTVVRWIVTGDKWRDQHFG